MSFRLQAGHGRYNGNSSRKISIVADANLAELTFEFTKMDWTFQWNPPYDSFTIGFFWIPVVLVDLAVNAVKYQTLRRRRLMFISVERGDGQDYNLVETSGILV